MNTGAVNSAAGVILAALTQNRTATGIALALDSAQLLQSPETAAQAERLETGPVLPWAHAMSDHDLSGFLDELLSAASGRWQHSPEVPNRVTLAEIEKACARWKTPGEGSRLDGSELDGVTVQIAPRLSLEDPHDSPLHRAYKVPHDLPPLGGA